MFAGSRGGESRHKNGCRQCLRSSIPGEEQDPWNRLFPSLCAHVSFRVLFRGLSQGWLMEGALLLFLWLNVTGTWTSHVPIFCSNFVPVWFRGDY